jgi:SAM-dependent methyltransferase
VQPGFPLRLLRLVCCSTDRGPLRPSAHTVGAFMAAGDVHCVTCGKSYPIWNGILSLLDQQRLHPDSAMEMKVRDARSTALLDGRRLEWRSRFSDETEVQPTLDALGSAPGMTVCELGCGPGRYTLALAQRALAVVAVDFSIAGLLVLKAKLDADMPVALVQADVTRPYGTARAFDRMLSTLHSNLPDRDHRSEALHWMAEGLNDAGRAVVSMHHYSTRDVIARTPASGRYPENGVYRYFMTAKESLHETAAHFGRVRHAHVAVKVPGIPSVRVSKAVARVRVLREGLSGLLLALAERPMRTGMAQRLAAPDADGGALSPEGRSS